MKKTVLNYLLIVMASCVLSCQKTPLVTASKMNQTLTADTVVQTPWNYDSPFPFDLPSTASLRSSGKKVFAHYFTQFPISIDNKDPSIDYYQHGYLAPDGESGKHLSYGGYLRFRPLPQPTLPGSDWMEKNMEQEVKRAIAIGLDGFTLDILDNQGYHWDRANLLLQAAHNVDPGFKIVLMPDMNATIFQTHPEEVANVIKTLSTYPAAYRTVDDRLVVSPYNAQKQTIGWWKNWLTTMQSAGFNIAFFPVFQKWEDYAKDFAPVSFGMSDWGWRSVSDQASWLSVPAKAKSYGPIWMMPVSPQDVRPYQQRYWEAGNSAEYRVMWENAINGGADWVQLATWCDYSESTVVAPSTGTQYAFYDLTAYYNTWFKTGTRPDIKRDVLYYFYRLHAMSATPEKQTALFHLDSGSDPATDLIEVVAFLTQPGTVETDIAGKTFQQQAPAGLSSFKVPLSAGKPVFRLLRNNASVITLPGAFEINNDIDYQNPVYFGGSNSRLPVSSN